MNGHNQLFMLTTTVVRAGWIIVATWMEIKAPVVLLSPPDTRYTWF